MRILTTIILILTISPSCGPNNEDFDPFDNEYRFHQKFKLSDYDTIVGECGYWNLTNRNDGTYYQFYLGEKEILAKGFDITIDDIKVEFGDNGPSNREFIEVLEKHPIDTNRIKSFLQLYKLKKVTFLYDTTSLTGLKVVDQKDSVYLLDVTAFWNGQSIERQVRYYNGRD